MYITDYTNSITAKLFANKEKSKPLFNKLKLGGHVKLKGECIFDNYQRELVIMTDSIMTTFKQERMDRTEQKVELHLHTHEFNGWYNSNKKLIDRAAKWGHKAIAITDHGVVQAFRKPMKQVKSGIKILYGEGYLINDCKPIVVNSNELDFNQTLLSWI